METQQAATPSDAAPQSLEDRIFAKAGIEPEPQPEPEPQADQPQADEPQAEAEPVAEPQDDSIDFDLLHNGDTKKVTSKAELKRLAQMGYDYDHNIGRAKEEYRKAQSMAQAVQAQQVLQPQILEALAEAKSYEKSLKEFANLDWQKETQTDPIGAFQKRMQYDQLQSGFQAALQKAQYIGAQFQQAGSFVDKTRAELEASRLREAVPEWRDDAVRQKEGKEVIQTLQSRYGFTPEEIQGMERSGILFDHRFVRLMRDSWKYQQASNLKGNRVPQGLPPAKPQARQAPRSDANATADIKRALHQPNISKGQRKAAEDLLIARKFGIK